MVMSPAGLGTKNDCAGEGQQQLPDKPLHCFEWSEDIQNRQILKYGYESRGTQNQEILCWRGPAGIYKIDCCTVLSGL
jgi:hypothetical protein